MKRLLAIVFAILFTLTGLDLYSAELGSPARIVIGNTVSPEFDSFRIDSINIREKFRLINVVIELYRNGKTVGYQTVNIYGEDYDLMLSSGITKESIERYIVEKLIQR